MYRTSAEVATHEEPWATLIRLGLQEVYHYLREVHDDDAPWEYGIPVFDRLTHGQKLALMVHVGRALLIAEEPEPNLTAAVEAAVAVVFEGILSGIQTECEIVKGHDSFRAALLTVYKSEPTGRRLPKATCEDVAEWKSLVRSLADEVRWDDDYLNEAPFLDVPPEVSDLVKEAMDIDANYYIVVPPDPPDEKLEELAVELRRLAG